MRDELMPCPFCGDDDVSYVSRDVGVVCNGCGATGPHDQPAAVWNQRSALDARCGSGVADGWLMVPLEPIDEMIEGGCAENVGTEVWPDDFDSVAKRIRRKNMRAAWSAMVSRAPPPPAATPNPLRHTPAELCAEYAKGREDGWGAAIAKVKASGTAWIGEQPKVCTNCASDGRCMKRQALCEFTKSQQPNAQAGEDAERCAWKVVDGDSDTYATSCGEMHVFTVGGPEENRHKHCPYCGELIEQGSRAEGGDA